LAMTTRSPAIASADRNVGSVISIIKHRTASTGSCSRATASTSTAVLGFVVGASCGCSVALADLGAMSFLWKIHECEFVRRCLTRQLTTASPPAEKATARQDQAGEASAGDWTTPNPPGPSKKVGGSGPPLQVLQPFEGLKVE
jgi:hypothetical protein